MPACDDGIDNDGDGKIDYPNDPGCVLPQQDDETDDCPSGPGCPECGNGIDDNEDGFIDYPADPGCTSAADTSEYLDNPNACGTGLTIKGLPASGTDTGMLDGTSTSMITTTCGGGNGASAVAYLIHLPSPKVMVATTDFPATTVDTVLDLRSDNCLDASAHITCNDNIGTRKPSLITQSLAAGSYYLIVQGKTATDTGPYQLQVQLFQGEGAVCTVQADCGPSLVCRTPVGGSQMICTDPVCSDGIDDDADGKIDYPNDPGCTDPADSTEEDDCPSGPMCPECGNGLDDDGDGQIDFPADASCTSASSNSEACDQSEPVNVITSGATLGTTAGQVNDYRPPPGSLNGRLCSTSSATGHTAPDVAYVLDLPAMRQLNLDIDFPGTSWDSTSVLLDSTCGTAVACSDSPTHLPRFNVPAGRYYVVIDGYSTASGAFQFNVDGVIAPGGRCGPEVDLAGALACPATNPCEGAVGMMRCRPTLCNDGIDNDGDGLTDFPLDPGCASADDEDEADTCPGVGPGCPECADGFDNDGDGQTDYPADTNCTGPSMNSEGCTSTDGVIALVQPTFSGTTVGAFNDVVPTCGSTTTQTAPDHTFSLELPAMRQFTILNDNSFDAAVSLLDSTCTGTPLICNDTPEHISLNNVPAGTYYYVVDGWSSGAGTYDLTISGIIQNAGSCEVPLALSGALTCAPGYTCKGTSGARTCQRAQCSDGIDNDGDGIADYPNDPGCSSPTDDDEANTCPGIGCPECSDGIDNDADGETDYPDDPSCASASSASEACFSSEDIIALTDPVTDGTLVGAVDDWFPACGGTFPHSAPDLLYSLELPALTTLSINNANSFDAVISMFRGSCETPEIFCDDEPENLTLANLAAGTYYYLVDGDGTAANSYTITVSGTIVNGQSCESPLAQSGALTCSVGYACAGTIGARTCQPAACNDGVDNDSDGLTDYPFDPGCASISDGDETDPAIPPVCSNGLDDDGDGLIDFPADPNCTAASGAFESCEQTEPVATITAAATMGTTVGQTNDVVPDCGSTTTQTAPDVAYALPIPAMATLTVNLTASFDSAHSVLGPSCAGAPIRCSDPVTMPTLTNVGPGTYYVVVDGWSSASGPFTINTSGTVAPGGSCEGALFQAGVFTCVAGTTCSGPTGARTCRSQCSDGIDNNSDGLIDYPYDPACSSAADDTEDTVCVGTACPVCSNTLDDDTDALTDFPADHGCTSAGGTSEVFCPVETDPTAVITSTPVTGTTTGMTSDFATTTAQCATSTGEDVAYALSLPVAVETLVLDSTGSSFNTVLSLRDAQCAELFGCDRNSGPGNASVLTLSSLRAGNYAVIIDGFSSADGAYTVSIKGTVAPGTACTDALFTSGVLACRIGTTCTAGTCQ